LNIFRIRCYNKAWYNNIKFLPSEEKKQATNIMAENNLKLRLGIIRPRFNDYLKSKGRKSMSKKRFSKASLRKTSKHTLT
jgi:hypothetical protein